MVLTAGLSPKENLLRAIYFRDPEHVPYPGENAYCFVDHLGRKPPRDGLDEWGVSWAPLPEDYRPGAGEPAESFPVAHPAHTADDLLRWPFPDATDPALFAGLLRGSDPRQTLMVGRHPAGPLERFLSLLGVEAAFTTLLQEPEISRAVLGRIAGYHEAIARGYVANGAEAGWLADDYAGQDGPMLNPALWREMVLPGLRGIIRIYREAGFPVFFHTCGRADPFLADLIDAGVTVFNLESAACDLVAVRGRFGRSMAIAGGIAPDVMLRGRAVDVEMAVRQAIRSLGPDGGLILAPDQSLAYPAENEDVLNFTVQRYGIYPLVV
jgi:uroporphyrinogen decarboxylase